MYYRTTVLETEKPIIQHLRDHKIPSREIHAVKGQQAFAKHENPPEDALAVEGLVRVKTRMDTPIYLRVLEVPIVKDLVKLGNQAELQSFPWTVEGYVLVDRQNLKIAICTEDARSLHVDGNGDVFCHRVKLYSLYGFCLDLENGAFEPYEEGKSKYTYKP